jgi:GAF domain-containing protein
LVSTFASLQTLTLTAPQVNGFLSDVTDLAVRLGGPLSCSITLAEDGAPSTVAWSDDLASGLDETQYGDGEGPCLEALRTGASTHVEDMRTEVRWPTFRRRAQQAGAQSSLSLPLAVTGTPIGALNLYSTQPRGFDAQLQRSLGIFAAQVAAALTMVVRQSQQAQVSAQLEQALASRTLIDQALGILMAEQRCTAEVAFTLLRAHSQNTNRKLRDVAADLIQRVSGAPPTLGTPFRRAAGT